MNKFVINYYMLLIFNTLQLILKSSNFAQPDKKKP